MEYFPNYGKFMFRIHTSTWHGTSVQWQGGFASIKSLRTLKTNYTQFHALVF